jgi:hypothetical protein
MSGLRSVPSKVSSITRQTLPRSCTPRQPKKHRMAAAAHPTKIMLYVRMYARRARVSFFAAHGLEIGPLSIVDAGRGFFDERGRRLTLADDNAVVRRANAGRVGGALNASRMLVGRWRRSMALLSFELWALSR